MDKVRLGEDHLPVRGEGGGRRGPGPVLVPRHRSRSPRARHGQGPGRGHTLCARLEAVSPVRRDRDCHGGSRACTDELIHEAQAGSNAAAAHGTESARKGTGKEGGRAGGRSPRARLHWRGQSCGRRGRDSERRRALREEADQRRDGRGAGRLGGISRSGDGRGHREPEGLRHEKGARAEEYA